MEMLSRDEGRRLELDGVEWGLERALDLIDMPEEEQGHQAPHPQPRFLIDGGDDLSEEMDDGQEEEPSREAPITDGPQAQGKPTLKEL